VLSQVFRAALPLSLSPAPAFTPPVPMNGVGVLTEAADTSYGVSHLTPPFRHMFLEGDGGKFYGAVRSAFVVLFGVVPFSPPLGQGWFGFFFFPLS